MFTTKGLRGCGGIHFAVLGSYTMHSFMIWKTVVSWMETAKRICLLSTIYVFLPRINNQLRQFVSAWNNHPLRTENGLTPLQLFNRGILSASVDLQADIASGLAVDDDFGVDVGASMFCSNLHGVVIPEVRFTLTDSQLDYVQQNFNLLQRSDYNGVDIYIQLKEYSLCSNIRSTLGQSKSTMHGKSRVQGMFKFTIHRVASW